MSEFFFRDSIPEFWKLIYSKYRRLHSVLGREPFKFAAPDPNIQPLEQYLPGAGDTIMIAFMGEDGTEAISVDAEFQPDRGLVQVMSYYQGACDTNADSLWKTVLSSLAKDPRWLDPAQPVPSTPQKPAPGSSLDLWFDYYHAMHAAHFNYTFNDLARASGHTAGHLANMHGNYKRERGLARSKKDLIKT
jgi:hypothetical protein